MFRCRGRVASRSSGSRSRRRTGPRCSSSPATPINGRAQALGADHVLEREGWVEAVHYITGCKGFDHILDFVGGPHLARSLEAVAVQGRVSVIGVVEGYDLVGSAGLLLLKMATVQGIRVGHSRALEDLVRAVDLLGLKPMIHRHYPLAELTNALDHLDRGAFGKLVITLD